MNFPKMYALKNEFKLYEKLHVYYSSCVKLCIVLKFNAFFQSSTYIYK